MTLPGLDDWLQHGSRCAHGASHADDCPRCSPEHFCRHGVPAAEADQGDCDQCNAEAEEAAA